MNVHVFKVHLGLFIHHTQQLHSYTHTASSSKSHGARRVIATMRSPFARSFRARLSGARSFGAPVRASTGNRPFSSRKDDTWGVLVMIALRMAARLGGRLFGQALQHGVQGRDLKHVYRAVGVMFLGSFGLHCYFSETIPYSNRSHLVLMSAGEEVRLSQASVSSILSAERDRVLPAGDVIVGSVTRIATDLIQVCKQDGVVAKHMDFEIHVIRSPVLNAFVLPNGHIFLYTGILPIAATEGGLASILGHEISHALARHSAEKMTNFQILMLMYEFMRGFGEGFDGGSWKAAVLEFIAMTVLQVTLPLAHSRRMESEADRMGCLIAAKAGYDPRHAVDVWRRMLEFEKKASSSDPSTAQSSSATAESLSASKRIAEVFSTHPCHERRIKELEKYVQEILPEYYSANDQLSLLGIDKTKSSERPILASNHKAVTWDGTGEFKDPVVYDYDENSIAASAALAGRGASLMAGMSHEEENLLWEALKVIGMKVP